MIIMLLKLEYTADEYLFLFFNRIPIMKRVNVFFPDVWDEMEGNEKTGK